MNDLETFTAFVEALGASRSRVIIIGGWAFRLYALHPLAAPQTSIIVTNDVDVLFTSESAEGLSTRLESAGFRPRYKSGDERPPVTDYVNPANVGSPIEFLVAERRTRKSAPPTVTIDGVNAVTLRGLEPLAVQPWEVTLAANHGFSLATPTVVNVPNPIAFALHKLIISKRRPARAKREKDILYAFDTFVLFSGRERELDACWPAVSRTLTRAMVTSLRELAKSLESPNDPVRGAARIATAGGRQAPPLPEQISATLAERLKHFGF